MSWEAPGYVAEELLGFGASGEVWRGRDTSTGEVVALKRLRVGRDPADHDNLRREAALLSAFRHPNLVRLRAAVFTRDGLVLVLDHAAGGSLGGLLARQGALPAARVVGLLRPLAHVLAAAHAAGLLHGDISGGNVLLDAAGQPLLADLGTARLVGDPPAPVYATAGFGDPAVAAGRPPGPESDVYALGALAVIALAGPAATADPAAAARGLAGPEPLVSLLRRMVRADPDGRPSAAEVAGELDAAAGPVLAEGVGAADVSSLALTHAVRVADPPAPRHRTPPSPGPPRRRRGTLAASRSASFGKVLAAGAGLLAVAVAAWLGFRWGGSVPAQQPSAVATSSVPSWSQVWARIDARRGDAFARADATLLDRVYLPGSQGLPADLRAVRDLSARHEYAVGVRHQTRNVRVESYAGGSATLLVVDRMGGYQVRDAAGRVVARAGPRGERRLRAGLVSTERGWLISTLTPA